MAFKALLLALPVATFSDSTHCPCSTTLPNSRDCQACLNARCNAGGNGIRKYCAGKPWCEKSAQGYVHNCMHYTMNVPQLRSTLFCGASSSYCGQACAGQTTSCTQECTDAYFQARSACQSFPWAEQYETTTPPVPCLHHPAQDALSKATHCPCTTTLPNSKDCLACLTARCNAGAAGIRKHCEGKPWCEKSAQGFTYNCMHYTMNVPQLRSTQFCGSSSSYCGQACTGQPAECTHECTQAYSHARSTCMSFPWPEPIEPMQQEPCPAQLRI